MIQHDEHGNEIEDDGFITHPNDLTTINTQPEHLKDCD